MIGIRSSSTLIAIPSKCGWLGLKYTLIDYLKVGIQEKPHHDAVILDKYDIRILIGREPLERWVSLYWFIKNHHKSTHGTWGKHLNHFKTFRAFSEWVISYDGNLLMMKPQTWYEKFNPHKIIMQESIDKRWGEFLNPEWKEVYDRKSKHPTRNRKTVHETTKKGMSKKFIDLLEAEQCFLQSHYEKTPPHKK